MVVPVIRLMSLIGIVNELGFSFLSSVKIVSMYGKLLAIVIYYYAVVSRQLQQREMT